MIKDINEDVNEDINEDNKDNKDDNEVNEDINEEVNKELNSINESFNEDIDTDNLMLSTIDNPYSPKEDYDMWKQWDKENGYNTEEYIARLINMEVEYEVDDEFTLNIITSKVINDILENDDLQIYILI